MTTSKWEKLTKYSVQLCVVILILYGVNFPNSFWIICLCESISLNSQLVPKNLQKIFLFTALILLVCIDIVYTVCSVSLIIWFSSWKNTIIPIIMNAFYFFLLKKEKSNAQFSMLICSATVSLALAGAIIISLWAIFGSWFFGLSFQIGCITESQHLQQSYGHNEFNMNGFLLVWTVWILVAISTGLLYFLFEKLCVWLIFICVFFSD